MGRAKNEIVVRMEAHIDDIFDALNETPDYKCKLTVRKNTPEPYIEVRIDSQVLFDVSHADPITGTYICDHLKKRVPALIGGYPKQLIRGNKVLKHNNVCRAGLLFHIPL